MKKALNHIFNIGFLNSSAYGTLKEIYENHVPRPKAMLAIFFASFVYSLVFSVGYIALNAIMIILTRLLVWGPISLLYIKSTMTFHFDIQGFTLLLQISLWLSFYIIVISTGWRQAQSKHEKSRNIFWRLSQIKFISPFMWLFLLQVFFLILPINLMDNPFKTPLVIGFISNLFIAPLMAWGAYDFVMKAKSKTT